MIIIQPTGEDEYPEKVAEIIRSMLTEKRHENHLPYDLKISLGYDKLRDQNDSIHSCMKRADEKLYLDKNRSSNIFLSERRTDDHR